MVVAILTRVPERQRARLLGCASKFARGGERKGSPSPSVAAQTSTQARAGGLMLMMPHMLRPRRHTQRGAEMETLRELPTRGNQERAPDNQEARHIGRLARHAETHKAASKDSPFALAIHASRHPSPYHMPAAGQAHKANTPNRLRYQSRGSRSPHRELRTLFGGTTSPIVPISSDDLNRMPECGRQAL